jgi:hypothetical protein
MMDFDDYKKAGEEYRKMLAEHRKRCGEPDPKSIDRDPVKYHDHPNTMENGPAIMLYIFTMVGGAIFNDRWLIWIIATILFIRFMTRHSR